MANLNIKNNELALIKAEEKQVEIKESEPNPDLALQLFQLTRDVKKNFQAIYHLLDSVDAIPFSLFDFESSFHSLHAFNDPALTRLYLSKPHNCIALGDALIVLVAGNDLGPAEEILELEMDYSDFLWGHDEANHYIDHYHRKLAASLMSMSQQFLKRNPDDSRILVLMRTAIEAIEKITQRSQDDLNAYSEYCRIYSNTIFHLALRMRNTNLPIAIQLLEDSISILNWVHPDQQYKPWMRAKHLVACGYALAMEKQEEGDWHFAIKVSHKVITIANWILTSSKLSRKHRDDLFIFIAHAHCILGGIFASNQVGLIVAIMQFRSALEIIDLKIKKIDHSNERNFIYFQLESTRHKLAHYYHNQRQYKKAIRILTSILKNPVSPFSDDDLLLCRKDLILFHFNFAKQLQFSSQYESAIYHFHRVIALAEPIDGLQDEFIVPAQTAIAENQQRLATLTEIVLANVGDNNETPPSPNSMYRFFAGAGIGEEEFKRVEPKQKGHKRSHSK